MIKNSKVKVGDHCWALSCNELLIVLKTERDGYEVCGAWECGMSYNELEIISIIKKPKKYIKTKLYYLNK